MITLKSIGQCLSLDPWSTLLSSQSEGGREWQSSGTDQKVKLVSSYFTYLTFTLSVSPIPTPSYLNFYNHITLMKATTPFLLLKQGRSLTLKYATFVRLEKMMRLICRLLTGPICTCTTSFLPQPPLPPLLTCHHSHRPNAFNPFLTLTGIPMCQPSYIRTSDQL